jgi:hypothetical protein
MRSILLYRLHLFALFLVHIISRNFAVPLSLNALLNWNCDNGLSKIFRINISYHSSCTLFLFLQWAMKPETCPSVVRRTFFRVSYSSLMLWHVFEGKCKPKLPSVIYYIYKEHFISSFILNITYVTWWWKYISYADVFVSATRTMKIDVIIHKFPKLVVEQRQKYI